MGVRVSQTLSGVQQATPRAFLPSLRAMSPYSTVVGLTREAVSSGVGWGLSSRFGSLLWAIWVF